MYEAGHPKLVLCDNREGWGEGGKWGIQGGENACIPVADSYRYMAAAITIL